MTAVDSVLSQGLNYPTPYNSNWMLSATPAVRLIQEPHLTHSVLRSSSNCSNCWLGIKSVSDVRQTVMHHGNSAFHLFSPTTSEHIMGLLLLEVLLTSLPMQLSGLHGTYLHSLGTLRPRCFSIAILHHSFTSALTSRACEIISNNKQHTSRKWDSLQEWLSPVFRQISNSVAYSTLFY